MELIILRTPLQLSDPEVGIIINCEYFPNSNEISCTVANQGGSEIMLNGYQQKSLYFNAFYGDILTIRDTCIIFLVPELPRTVHSYDIYELEKIVSFIERNGVIQRGPEKSSPDHQKVLIDRVVLGQTNTIQAKYFCAEKRMQVSLQLKIERGRFEILYASVTHEEDDGTNCRNNGSYGSGCFYGNMQSENPKCNENNSNFIPAYQCELEAGDEKDIDEKMNDDDDDDTKKPPLKPKKRNMLMDNNDNEVKRSESLNLTKRAKMQGSILSSEEDVKREEDRLILFGSLPINNFNQYKSKGLGAPLLYHQSYGGHNIASVKPPQSNFLKLFNGPYGKQPQRPDLNNMSSVKFPTTSPSPPLYNCQKTAETGSLMDVAPSAANSQSKGQDPSPPPRMCKRNRMCL